MIVNYAYHNGGIRFARDSGVLDPSFTDMVCSENQGVDAPYLLRCQDDLAIRPIRSWTQTPRAFHGYITQHGPLFYYGLRTNGRRHAVCVYGADDGAGTVRIDDPEPMDAARAQVEAPLANLLQALPPVHGAPLFHARH